MKATILASVLDNSERLSPGLGWKSVKLREIALVVNGFGFPETLQGTRDLSVPFIKVSDMNAAGSERVVCSAANTVSATMLREIGAKTYPPGTIIFPKVGGALLTNKKRVLGVEATFDNNIMGVVPENADSEWLYYWLQTIDLRTLANTQALPSIRQSDVGSLTLNLPPPPEQRRIAAHLREELAEVAKAQAATRTQSESLGLLTYALLRESLSNGRTQTLKIAECLREVTEGIGSDWSKYPVLGATRSGLAPAKEPVGKKPGRYKPVRPGTIFYNPMRILLGSIAMADEDDPPGITSPDYVVMTAIDGKLNARWFYHWFRSRYGEDFIRSLTRGAVRERLLFRRLGSAVIQLPDWGTQQQVANLLFEARRAKEKLQDKLHILDQLPAALLRQAFSSKV